MSGPIPSPVTLLAAALEARFGPSCRVVLEDHVSTRIDYLSVNTPHANSSRLSGRQTASHEARVNPSPDHQNRSRLWHKR
jgi:hypothetical protein